MPWSLMASVFAATSLPQSAALQTSRCASFVTVTLLGGVKQTYSRAKGLFAGVSLEGSTLRPDNGANKKLYNRKITASEIVLEHKTVPVEGQELVQLLQRVSPTNRSN